MSDTTHEISDRKEGRRAVATKACKGPWAIHGDRTRKGVASRWTVTHLPTGLAGRHTRTLKEARDWMKGAATVDVPAPADGWTWAEASDEDAASWTALVAANEAGMAAIVAKRPKRRGATSMTWADSLTINLHRVETGTALSCHGCGAILDCRRSVSYSHPTRGAGVLCGKCWDASTGGKVLVPDGIATVDDADIVDGRHFTLSAFNAAERVCR